MTKLKKLVIMSPRELYSRVGHKLIEIEDRIRYECRIGHNPTCTGSMESQAHGGQYPPRFPMVLEKDRLQIMIRNKFPEIARKRIEKADRLMDWEFEFLGIRFNTEGKPDWRRDPVTGKEWPAGYCFDMPIFSGDIGYGDVKHVWELNRHQFLADLGIAYWITGDERYSERVAFLIEDWIDNNPYMKGINWSSSLEVAVRAISWIWIARFLEGSEHARGKTGNRILHSLAQHGNFLERYLSRYFSPYNHLIGEACGLYLIGVFYPNLPKASKWKDDGWELLCEEIGKQFHSDGFSVEQSTGYHKFTLGFFLQAALVRMRSGLGLPDGFKKDLEKALSAAMWMQKPDGLMATIGDADDSISLCLDNLSSSDLRGYLSIGATLFQRPDMKHCSRDFGESAIWLFGEEGYKRFEAISAKEPSETSKGIEASGYFIMRNNWGKDSHWLCFDCGELAAGVHRDDTCSSAHGHADMLSVAVDVFGVPTIVDPGFYTYNGNFEWHKYFRETAAHSTLLVDGFGQSFHGGKKLIWSNVSSFIQEEWITCESFDWVQGSIDGYKKVPGVGIHRRAVYFNKPYYWIIYDAIEGTGDHTIEINFHFSRDIDFANADWTGVETCDAMKENLMVGMAAGKSILKIKKGEGGPEGGWIAPSYNVLARGPVASFTSKESLPASFFTVVYPYKGSDLFLDGLEQHNGVKNGSGICIKNSDWIDCFSVKTGRGRLEMGNIQSDARVLVTRNNASGDLENAILIGGSDLRVSGEQVFSSKQRRKWVSFKEVRKRLELDAIGDVDAEQGS